MVRVHKKKRKFVDTASGNLQFCDNFLDEIDSGCSFLMKSMVDVGVLGKRCCFVTLTAIAEYLRPRCEISNLLRTVSADKPEAGASRNEDFLTDEKPYQV